MLRSMIKTGMGMVLMLLATLPVHSQDLDPSQDSYPSEIKIDPYLDVEVWPNQNDGEYYEGDNIVIHFRASADAFVAIYSVDTRGRVHLIFPSEPGEDNFVRGGVSYDLPGRNDDYDLEVSGPEGMEHLQIVASREKFPIPNWYHNSGLVYEGDDVNDYMDFLNSRHFVRYGGQRFAFDRATIYVNEWEQYYYRPVYHSYYPSWSVYGNAYIDYGYYGYGGSVYVNGIYYGHTPLYIPRLLVGWHYVTIYDHHGHAWESPFHVSYYNTTVFNHNHIRTSPHTVSRYKEVRHAGYRDPVRSGYPNYKKRAVVKQAGNGSVKPNVGRYKFARGSIALTKSSRGYETASVTHNTRSKELRSGNGSRFRGSRAGTQVGQKLNKGVVSTRKKSSDTYHAKSSRNAERSVRSSTKSGDSRGSSDYYEKKSSSGKRSSGKTVKTRDGSGQSRSKASSKSGRVKTSSKGSSSKKSSAGKSSKSGSGSKSTVKARSSGSKGKSSGTKAKSGGSSSRSSGKVSGRSSGRSGSGSKKSGGGRSSGGSKGSRPR